MNFKLLLLILVTSFTSAIFAQPTVDFQVSTQEACVGESIDFIDLSTSTLTITGWTWDFGDGNSSNLQNPSHTYALPNTYTIILTATDANGTDFKAEVNYIVIHPLPNPEFTIPSIGCEIPFTMNISGVSPAGDNSYNWDFGNGQSSASMTPSAVVYDAAGTYAVSLTVTDNTTTCVNSIIHNITVVDYQANFSLPVSVCVGTSAAFTDLSTAGTNQWSWDFGGLGTSTQQNPNFTFNTPGDYDVTLTSTNSTTGCSEVVTQSITILSSPVPSFNASVLGGCAPLSVDFTNTTGIAGTYNWDFGNGNTFAGENPPTEVYTTNGVYDVMLTVVDENGCFGTVTETNYITVSPLVADFQADVEEGCEDLAVQFTDLSIAPDPASEPITQWLWDFGDGTTFIGQNPPIHLFPEGKYDVTLTVSTASGCLETVTFTDYIQVGTLPIVNFSVDHNLDCAKQDFVFTNESTISVPFDPSDVEFEWDFGDGGNSTQENPTYNYPIDTGYFEVSLIVDFRGCRDSLSIADFVYINAPISIFSPENTVFCNPTFPVTLNVTDNAILGNETVPDDIQMIWSWGDGQIDILEDADLYDSDAGSMSHDYVAAGTYTVKQVVHNFTTGCSDSTEQVINFSTIAASGILETDSICRGESINLSSTSISSHPITLTTINNGDGINLTGASVNSTYNVAGQFIPVITVTNSLGCTATADMPLLEVLELPVAVISASDLTGCADLTVSYTNNSFTTGNGVSLSSFNWTFPDLSTETTSNVSTTTTYELTTQGNFTTSLTAIDVFGCVSTPVEVSTLITLPVPNFSFAPIVCNEIDVSFTNTSTDAVTSQWIIDGEPVSIITDLVHVFNDIGSATTISQDHEVQLMVTDVNGCVDSITQIITVSLPYADADYLFSGANVNTNGDFVCPPVYAEFTDLSGSIGSITNYSWDFGDGKFSTEQNPDNTYVFAGVYTATMEITDEYGCSDTTIFFEYLEIGGPQADVSWNAIGDICSPVYEFVPENMTGVSTIVWTLGDGTIMQSTTPFQYEYTTMGDYIPLVSIQDNNGCEVPVELPEITIVSNDLVAQFNFNPSTAEVGENVSVIDQSTGGFNGIIDWNWAIDDEAFNNAGGFDYIWQIPGIHIVELIVTDEAGCQSTYQSEILITTEVIIPNVFTPNGDGINDEMVLEFAAFKDFEVIILNRWGNVVHEGSGLNGVLLWDGRMKSGVLCSEGVYFYQVDGILYDDTQLSKHGFVTLKY